VTAPAIPTPATELEPRRPRSRPTTEYWDVFTASWRTRGPVIPAPRSED
jgi:hypothetical protein